MDQMDERILDLMKGNARITYQELGDRLGISRVAAKKRVKKLEKMASSEAITREFTGRMRLRLLLTS